MSVVIDEDLLERLLEEAAANPRLRTNYDLRGGETDTSQRMLNALQPGTKVPIHRHHTTAETVILLKGRIDELYFDNDGNITERVPLEANGPNRGVQIEADRWHTIEVHEPSVIIEMKDGAYRPFAADEIM